MTDEQLGLQRDVIGVVNGDRDGNIDAATLAIALGFLKGTYVPLGEHDVLAIPVPGNGTVVKALLLDGDAANFTVRALVENGSGPNDRVLLDYSRLSEMRWSEIAHGPITDFRASPDEEPIFVLDEEGEHVCWGDAWQVPLPANAQWRASMMDMGIHDPAVPLIEVLDGNTLYEHGEGTVSDKGTDASNVIPPWSVETPLAWKAVRRDGAFFLEKHGEPPRYVGDAQMSQVFACGQEMVAVDRVLPPRSGTVQFRPFCNADGPIEDQRPVPLENCWIRVLNLAATNLHYIITFNLDADDSGRGPARRQRRQVMVRNRDGSDRVEEDGDLIEAGWHPVEKVSTLTTGSGVRAVIVEMGRRDERDRVVERGVSVYTDHSHAFYRLRGVAFDALHVVGVTLWGWRPTPGGIILSRYPLP